jgi:transcriptional regulator with XRE-family HTH domain
MTKADQRLTIGDRIAIAREKYGLTQAKLGANLKVSRAAVSQYEKDLIRPRPEIFDMLAELFNADPEWFERGKGRAPQAHDAPVTIPEINVANVTHRLADPREAGNGRFWQVPRAAFSGVDISPDHMVTIQAPNPVGSIQAGDSVVIDTRRRKGEGIFLVLDVATRCPELRRYDGRKPDRSQIVGRAAGHFSVL